MDTIPNSVISSSNEQTKQQDQIDATTFHILRSAQSQAEKIIADYSVSPKEKEDAGKQLGNIVKMWKLAEKYPGSSVCRTNNLEEDVDILHGDAVLHMREGHSFDYTSGNRTYTYDTSRPYGHDPVPVFSMRHGIVLVSVIECRERFQYPIKDPFGMDIPLALSQVDEIPVQGVFLTTKPYRMQSSPENTHSLSYSRVNPGASIDPEVFFELSLAPIKR